MPDKKTALVTGAGRGIGAAIARELAQRGFHTVVNYLRAATDAANVVADIERNGGSACAAQGDVTSAQDVNSIVAEASRLDALICNANIAPQFGTVAELTWADFHRKVTGELAAAFHVTQAALPRMAPGSNIVYVSSTIADLTRPGAAAHATAKAALNTFARHVAAEAAPHGVAVNVVAPGFVHTDASAATLTPAQVAARAKDSVLGRILEPEDVARLIGALASGEFAGVTGAVVPLDSGYRILAR